MPHKTFENESFIVKNLNIDLNDLTSDDPYVNRVVIIPENNENVEEIGYSANKKVEKSAKKKDPISGIEFDATSEEKQDQKMSEIPEKLKKVQALVNDGKKVRITTNLGRYTNDDGENASFYLTDDHIEDMKAVVVEEDEEEEPEEESEEDSEEEDSVIL